MTFIFPHIPKSGGTSLKVQLEQAGLKVFFDYDAPPGPTAAQKSFEQRRNREYSLLDFSPFDLVFGHFPIVRYSRPDYRYIALVRDPLERAASHYFYQIQRSREGNRNLRGKNLAFAGNLASGTTTFPEFCEHLKLDRIYGRYLDYRRRGEFALIGDTSRYSEFVQGLNELLGTRLNADVWERKGTDMNLLRIPSHELNEARELMQRETMWYRALTGVAT